MSTELLAPAATPPIAVGESAAAPTAPTAASTPVAEGHFRTAASPHLYLAIFGAWFLCLLWFHPRLVGLMAMAETPLQWVALGFFVVFIEFAWLYGFYNLGVVTFAWYHRRTQPPARAVTRVAPELLPPVALLYTTCNDFVEKSAASCLAQEYPDFTLYLCDDSTEPEFWARVDEFAARHPGRVRVVRRGDRRGFKAGNLNHALASVATAEPFFALVDADEILPTDFLERLVPRMLAQPRCGFVQANHRANPEAAEPLQRAMGVGIDIHWKWYQPLRNRFGFPMLLGHGAVIRRRAWEDIGGFPEIVSEDLAFALRIREQGWRGEFAEEVVCYEDFPETVRAFRVRHMKWTRGTCEFLLREMPRALRSRRVPLAEKLDVLFPTLSLPLSLLYFLFMLDANLLLPALFGAPRPLTLELAGQSLVLPGWGFDPRFAAVMTPDFFAITLLTFMAPILCFIIELARRPLHLVRFISRSSAIYATLAPISSFGVMAYLVTRRATFLVTGDRTAASERTPGEQTGLRERMSRLLNRSHPDDLIIQGFEVLCGLGFGLLCLMTAQVSFLGLSFGFLLLPLLHHVRWERRAVQALVYVPFTLIFLGLFLGGLALFGMQPVFFGYGFHF
jgi:cellulose synthase/poly-beta-1,6-N-acetylglucosamine synthase-like glycosyltransferase